MAVSLSNHSFLAITRLSTFSSASSSTSSSSPKQSRTSVVFHNVHRSHRPPLVRPVLGFSTFSNGYNSSYRTRRAFKRNFSVPGREEDQRPISDLKKLIEVYKEAILSGDERTVDDIETRINIIVNDKNELLQRVSSLSEETTSGKEKFIRLQADFDNFRKRSEKESLTTRSDAQSEVIESLLSLVDSFEAAKQKVKPETEKEKKIDTSYQGIYKQFVEIMKSLQVAAVPTVGKPFDPALHEAIAREESEEFREGIIIQEVRRGFSIGNRLLRPAKVKVSAGPSRKKAPATSAEQPTTTAALDER